MSEELPETICPLKLKTLKDIFIEQVIKYDLNPKENLLIAGIRADIEAEAVKWVKEEVIIEGVFNFKDFSACNKRWMKRLDIIEEELK